MKYEISYDIEDFTPDDFVYLHGLLTRPADATRFGEAAFTDSAFGTYRAVCATAGEPEEQVWKRFLEVVDEVEGRGEYVVYVYSHHEEVALKKLTAKYGGSASLGAFLSRFVDLLGVVRRTVVFPIDSSGLKAVARFVGFDWRDEDPGGAESMAWWWEYARDPLGKAGMLERVIRYNEDDNRASFAIRDWLETHTEG